MREIKFRAWDGGKMIYQDADGYFDKVKHPKYPALQTLQLHSAMQVCEVMQFTGLYDKNGKEIYEGDVLCCPHFPANGSIHYLYHEVMWDEKICLFKTVSIGNEDGKEIKAHGNPMIWVYIKNEPECEVIGNIYENPELLTKNQSK